MKKTALAKLLGISCAVCLVGGGISMDIEKHTEGVYSQRELIEVGKKLLEDGNKEFVEAKIDPKEMSIMLFTSGTTSKSKVVIVSQQIHLKESEDLSLMVPMIRE